MSRRLSLTLEAVDEEVVEPFTQDSPERTALATLVAESSLSSDAAVLRALIRLGAETVRESLLEEGYAALAEEYRAERDDEHATLRARRARQDATRG